MHSMWTVLPDVFLKTCVALAGILTVVGALTVMSVSGDVLTLSDGGGETFTFDLASSSYT